ncbi:MAG: glycerol kinase GlpK, partial [Chitinivibrionales bacterium]|nr:glycerol kinase GlpK [Chitinivibrionales bacterium]
EQDPQAIYQSVLDAVGECVTALTENGRSAGDIRVCGISNQRETLLLWDESGTPLHNAVVWQCKRPVEICRRLAGTATEEAIRARTGLIVDPYFSGTKVIWLNENVPAVARALDAGEALFGTVDTWLLYRLTGGRAYLTDYTNACRTLFFNVDRLEWDRDLLEQFGMPRLRLPDCRSSAAEFGETDFEGRLPGPVPVGAMIGDSHASAFGQGCFDPGSAKVTMGTGSSVLMNTGKSRKESRTGMVSTICFSAADRVDYALEGIIVSCGSTLTWLKDQLRAYSDVGELEESARRLQSNEGVYIVPAFAGLGAPHWRMDARASIQGLTFQTSRDHILRAALESIAYQVKDVVAAMERDSGMSLEELVADGGISRNGFVMQLCADLLGARVVQRGIAEVSALGAACLAGLTSGIFSSIDGLRALHAAPRCYSPDTGNRTAEAGYQGWLQAVRKM